MSALIALSDSSTAEVSEDDDDEHDTPIWRSDMEQSARLASSMDNCNSNLLTQSKTKASASDLTHSKEDLVAHEEIDKISSLPHADNNQPPTEANEDIKLHENGSSNAHKKSANGELVPARVAVTQNSESKELETPTSGGASRDQFKLALNPTSGEVYFYNRRTRQSQWELPDPEVGVVVNMQDHPDPRAEQEYRILLATYEEELKRKQQRQKVSGTKSRFESQNAQDAGKEPNNVVSNAKLMQSEAPKHDECSQVDESTGALERRKRDDINDSSGVLPSSFQVADSELNLAASASVQSRHEPGTATRRLIFSSVSNSAQFRKNKTEEVDLPQEIRQAAVTLMAVSPAAGSAAHKANIMVSSLFCPYCGERTARDSLLQHLERTCSGVIAASKADHQKMRGIDANGFVWGSVSSVGSASRGLSERFGGGSAIKESAGRQRSGNGSVNGSFQQNSGSFGSVIKGNGDTSFLLDTLDEGEETFFNPAHNNNFQSKLFDADSAELQEGDDMDGLDTEGLLVQGPPSVVRLRNDSHSKRKGPRAREASSGSGHVDMNNLRTPKTSGGNAAVVDKW
eukprot:g4079.t1